MRTEYRMRDMVFYDAEQVFLKVYKLTQRRQAAHDGKPV